MNKHSKIYVAGHNGLVGSAILRYLQTQNFDQLLVRRRAELDLTRQADVEEFFAQQRPEYVFLAAAKVGGIHANNTYPAEFIRDNLLIQNHIIDAAYRFGVKKLTFLGSTCIYPKLAPQPMPEECLLTGSLEPTNEWYAIAKIAGIKMCQAYRKQYGFNAISVMPTNLYGQGDNFHLENAHVLPALIRRFHDAKQQKLPEVVVWGTGSPRREFLHVDDLATACVFLMQHYDQPEIVNIGTGQEVSIRELAQLIKDIVGYQGKLIFDESKPDGTPRKLSDVSKLTQLGWQAQINLEDGLKHTYQWFLANQNNIRE
ncbi:GDP-L-fucose synthase [Candidatus Albibeggiatoa sp. nov. NOAA]|uniref:GDP-L-fucose synthase n=1 Tax=Candidatus Albibeggiatoa sp. nov. NOAA TaxID=3162724 RepID=UPI0032F60590|nr:GDP-L-fucose synthase [Thiotrichaceae bacterium]